MRLSIRLCAVALAFFSFAAALRAAPPPQGQQDYLHGLDALQKQQWKEAAKFFAAAIDADDENAEYHTANAIAAMLSGDNKTAKEEFNRSLKLNPKDEPTQRWAAGYYRFIGDALTASKIRSSADYSGTVQEAAERVYQLKFDNVAPAEAQARWQKLYGFAADFARRRKTGDPGLTAASLDRAKQLFAAGKFEESLSDLQIVLGANPYDNEALFLESRCLVARGYLFGAREIITRVLTANTSFGAAYAVRAVVEARLGSIERAKADFELATKLAAPAANEASKDYEQAVKETQSDSASSPADRFAELVKAAAGQDNADSLVKPATAVLLAENSQRRRWDEIYQDRLRVLEDHVRAAPNQVGPLMDLGRFLYIESDIPGEQLSPGGIYRPFRFSNDHTRNAEIDRADKTFDKVLAIDANHAEALTWKAAIRLEHDHFDEGEALVNRAIQINPNLPQLLELLSRVLDNTATLQQFQATDLRTAKSWTQFGISYDIVWTHYPTQNELNRAESLQNQANRLWGQAEQSLSAAVAKMQGTADGAYYDGLLKSHQGDQNGALADFREAARLDANSSRNRQALIRALFQGGLADEAAVEKEKWTLEHQSTATMRLAKAWNDLDRTAWKSASAIIDSALQIDPADPRIPAYRAAIETARNKPEETVHWLVVALSLEQARIKLGGIDLRPGEKTPVPPDAGGLTLLLNLHLARRFHDLNQLDKAMATLDRNLAMDARVVNQWRGQKPAAAVMPVPSDPRSIRPRTMGNLQAWSHVLAGYNLVDQGKIAEARKQFEMVANWNKDASYTDAQALAYNEKERLRWAMNDPDKTRRKQWIASAHTMNRMTDEEQNLAWELIAQAGYKAGENMQQIQNEQMSLRYWYGAAPAHPGGYDPRANPNYQGNDDAPPGILPQ